MIDTSDTISRIYLAGRFSRKDELAAIAKTLTDDGYTITSRWLTGAHDQPADHELTSDELAQFAMHDLADIHDADTLVMLLEDASAGYMSGGRHVELGYALGKGKRVILVGDAPENVFHHNLPRVDNWELLHAYLRSMRRYWWDGSWTCSHCGEHVVMAGPPEKGMFYMHHWNTVVGTCPACDWLVAFKRGKPESPSTPFIAWTVNPTTGEERDIPDPASAPGEVPKWLAVSAADVERAMLTYHKTYGTISGLSRLAMGAVLDDFVARKTTR